MTDTQTHDAEHEQGHAHPDEAVYVRVALVLAVITGVEVALSYLKIGGNQVLTNGSLIVLAAVKFVTVALYFMHLKFDNRILRFLFFGGLILAILVYLVYLFTLHTFIG